MCYNLDKISICFFWLAAEIICRNLTGGRNLYVRVRNLRDDNLIHICLFIFFFCTGAKKLSTPLIVTKDVANNGTKSRCQILSMFKSTKYIINKVRKTLLRHLSREKLRGKKGLGIFVGNCTRF